MSDGLESYAIFLYADGLIQWTTSDDSGGINGLGGTPAHVGINAGDSQNYLSHEYSFTNEVISITQSRVPDNVVAGGMLVYKVDGQNMSENCGFVNDGRYVCMYIGAITTS